MVGNAQPRIRAEALIGFVECKNRLTMAKVIPLLPVFFRFLGAGQSSKRNDLSVTSGLSLSVTWQPIVALLDCIGLA